MLMYNDIRALAISEPNQLIRIEIGPYREQAWAPAHEVEATWAHSLNHPSKANRIHRAELHHREQA